MKSIISMYPNVANPEDRVSRGEAHLWQDRSGLCYSITSTLHNNTNCTFPQWINPVIYACLCLMSLQQIRSYGDEVNGLKFYCTDWRSRGANLRRLVYKASGLSPTPWRLQFRLCLIITSRNWDIFKQYRPKHEL